jgi:alanyl-tRNA synthetase
MTANEVRNSFLKFFEGKGHTIVPSAPVIPYDDPTLLFTNAGMNQFKDVFLGTGKRDYTRVADSQKCIRVSGKHNDLEEVGKDTYHHTFFEMLGNWSFGDYYKKEAITWAWELLTEVWKLPKNRLWATVYKTDDEADECWKKYTDINPSHVLRFGEKDNFWEMGETGPCGPCSEIHIDLSEKGDIGASLINAGLPEAIEIWNLVFIQYNRSDKGELEPLPAKHVDTGMGFERVVAILQGKKSNYDTDLFQPIIQATSELTGKRYSGSQSKIDISMRVVADHVRALTFAIADGAIPSNEGRGYVLRRILRRASRFGRNLDLHEPFIYKLVSSLVETMGDAYPEIKQKQSFVEQVIKGEEEGFNQTLDRGLEIFESVVTRIGHSKVFPGEDAFKLYDTYGFPLDLTELMAEERGLKVDTGIFTELMEEQKNRSRSTSKPKWMAGPGYGYISEPGNEEKARVEAEKAFDEELAKRDFLYDRYTIATNVAPFTAATELVKIQSGEFAEGLILDQTTFYCESGGQVSDTGFLTIHDPIPSRPSPRIRVIGLLRRGNRTVHVLDKDTLTGTVNRLLGTGISVSTDIDIPRREKIQRNHTATHIVHEALRQVLGTHLHQQGSLVAPDHLRFDFNHFQKISPEEIREIEDIVNEKIADDIPVHALNDPKDWITIDEAKRRYPNVKMFFGDKYGDRVRIVEIDPRFSVELCGGTHVKNTRDIGLFKIISESSVASGIRRIEAVTGKGIDDYIEKQLVKRAGELDDELARLIEEKERLEKELNVRPETKTEPETKRPSLGHVESAKPTLESIRSLESSLHERENAVSQLIDETKSLKRALSRKKVREEVSNIDDLLLDAVSLDGFKVVSAKVDASTMDELKSIADSLRAKIGSGVGVLGAVVQDKVALVCVVTDDIIKEKHIEAGKVVGELAKLVGGGGGGRPHLATAGGKDIQKLDEALKSTQGIVRSFLP